MKELYRAISNVTRNLGVLKKDANNPFFNSKYITLDNILLHLQPLLDAEELLLMQFPDETSAEQIAITTFIAHIPTGNSIQYKGTITSAKNMKDGSTNYDPQTSGGAFTYLKRYALGAIFMIVTDEDDDGNNASPRNTGQSQGQQRTQSQGQPPRTAAPPQGGGNGGKFAKCDPMPAGGYQCKIQRLREYQGVGKNGKPYTKIYISSQDNYECSAFSNKIEGSRGFLESLAGTDTEVIIHASMNGNYSNFESFEEVLGKP